MGNHTSFCYLEARKAKLVDVHGNLRLVKVPVTAAELMLLEPGHVVSQADNLRRTRRFQPLKADEQLFPGKLYMLVPLGRAHSVVCESTIALLDSACRKRLSKRSGSKILPAVTEGPGEMTPIPSPTEGPVTVLGLNGNDGTGFPGYLLAKHRQWKPILEPISEWD